MFLKKTFLIKTLKERQLKGFVYDGNAFKIFNFTSVR